MSLGCAFGGADDKPFQRLYRSSLWIHKNECQCSRLTRRGPRRFGAPPTPTPCHSHLRDTYFWSRVCEQDGKKGSVVHLVIESS